jgi:hypothetical protein
MDLEDYIGETVTIPRPMPSTYTRGQTVDRTFSDSPMSFRASADQKDLIERAAQALGMTPSDFNRWCSFRVALTVLDHKERHDRV